MQVFPFNQKANIEKMFTLSLMQMTYNYMAKLLNILWWWNIGQQSVDITGKLGPQINYNATGEKTRKPPKKRLI